MLSKTYFPGTRTQQFQFFKFHVKCFVFIGQDECNICGGNNSTCLDCAGVPNGGKVVDLCGSCLATSDPTFNTACSKLGTFSPKASYKEAGTKVVIDGSGMVRFSAVTCSFQSGATT